MIDNIPVIFCSSLSLIGQLLIVLLFMYSQKLRQGLIPRIILYLTFSGILQVLNLSIRLLAFYVRVLRIQNVLFLPLFDCTED
ncbi:unnamed protein product (macronuclear) [Paramecium tetraurelia]|uniref:Uncharacterized protein n=1 Tax=Paramecium tetraurelia TaxID=5888 RepID=A0D175_PARTE|nr:uncharacterized protein GSPATT00012316001 [Paramecium tetraurelia]CAK76792.1 unnamed protein product [Paramecium tetraurelia]|eukprot:XP_001444189.1 hypothetical protein (macronuclear) [Paramecium tetraurelia strain d4-2]